MTDKPEKIISFTTEFGGCGVMTIALDNQGRIWHHSYFNDYGERVENGEWNCLNGEKE